MILDSIGNRRIVDGMRSIGIILVIAFHGVTGLTSRLEPDVLAAYVTSFPKVLNVTWQALGSEIVFLFSGFLVSYLLFREYHATGRIHFADFYVRRMSRILPLFWMALLPYALIDNFTAPDLVLNLLFISKLTGATTIIPVGWSLELLVQMYLLLPVVIVLFLRSGHVVKLCIVGILLALAARFVALTLNPESYESHLYELLYGLKTPETQKDLYYLLPYRSSVFFLGILLAHLVVSRDQQLSQFLASRGRTLGVLAVSAMLILVCGFLPLHDQHSRLYALMPDQFWLWFWTLQRAGFSVGVIGISLCAWYSATRILTPIVWILQRDMWAIVSRNIYSIFLFHPIFLVIAAASVFQTFSIEEITTVHTAQIGLIVLIATVLSVVFGQALLRYLELPAQRRIRAWWEGRGRRA